MSGDTSDKTASVSEDSLTIVNPPPVDVVLDAIVAGAIQSLGAITPWCGVSTNHPDVLKVLVEVRGRGKDYCEAISQSVDTAQAGFDFSTDAISLCELLLAEDTPTDDIKDFIETMRADAKSCCEGSTATKNKFSEVRQGFLKITRSLPKEIVDTGSKSKWTISLPPICSRLFSGKGDERREVGYEDAIKGLQEVATHLANLTKSIDEFIAWWVKMETVLLGLARNANRLQGRNVSKITAMHKVWSKVNADYMVYKIKIVELQDHYPPSTLEAPA